MKLPRESSKDTINLRVGQAVRVCNPAHKRYGHEGTVLKFGQVLALIRVQCGNRTEDKWILHSSLEQVSASVKKRGES